MTIQSTTTHLRLIHSTEAPVEPCTNREADLAQIYGADFSRLWQQSLTPGANFLEQRRSAGLHPLQPLTFSYPAPVGWIHRTRWERASLLWKAAVHVLAKPARSLGDNGVELHPRDTTRHIRFLEQAALNVMDCPAPTSTDLEMQFRLLAAVIGCEEPGTIHILENHQASLVGRMLDRLCSAAQLQYGREIQLRSSRPAVKS